MAAQKNADEKKAAEVKADEKKAETESEVSAPYPSQEEADRIKEAAATGSAPYATRDMKA